ncbi:MAG: HAD family hydrolase [Acidobacteria bacterium]|nr:HAD family hydrolase [Acidobacteriota bacterium]
MLKIKAVVFDFDGTITKPYFDFGLIKDEIGMPRDRLIIEYLEGKDEKFVRHANEVLDKWEMKAAREAELNPNVLETMDLLKNNSIKTAVLTRNKRESIDIVMQKFPLSFDYIHTRDIEPVKPDPASMQAVIDNLGIDVSKTLTIGDYEHDIKCGKDAGTWTMYLTNGNGNLPNLSVKPDYVIKDFYEGYKIISSLI